MSLTDPTGPSDVALNTDLYELTMAQGFWEAGMAGTQACFNAFFREPPFGGGYAVCCGTGQVADLVESFSFDDSAVEYLSSLEAPGGGPLLKPAFLEFLRGHRLDLTVDVVPEGEVVFGREPMVRVMGPVIDCQLVETALLNLVNFQTLVATKCARVVRAAQGRPVSDFGLRRAQGPDGGLSVARASWVAGAASTSNVLAGRTYGIPVFGTHAHSWVMSFPTQLDAFRAFAASSPRNCTLLLDTYDVARGIEDAIVVAREMRERGEALAGVRIDSGDLARLSRQARDAFDRAGFPEVRISVSNDLDEYTVQSLLAQGAPIDAFGVGTKLATCDPQPSLGGVYKLSAIRPEGQREWTPVIKLSEQPYKRTVPGVQHVLRHRDASGRPVGDVIVDDSCALGPRPASMVDVMDPYASHELRGEASELLVRVVEHGRRVGGREGLDVARERCRRAVSQLDPAVARFLNPQAYPVGLEPGLARLRHELASAGAGGR